MHRTDKQINAYDQHLSIRILVGNIMDSTTDILLSSLDLLTDVLLAIAVSRSL